MDVSEIFKAFQEAAIEVTEDQIMQFQKLIEIFREWNSMINLSSMREEGDILMKHIIDSLLITRCMEFPDGTRCMDIGSGGGFPALPLAIYYPFIEVVACDSTGKKMHAVQMMAESLNLKNLKTLIDRAETAGRNPDHREKYDQVVARAVADLPVLLEYLSPFAKVGGKVAAYKTPEGEDELAFSYKAMGELSRLLFLLRPMLLQHD